MRKLLRSWLPGLAGHDDQPFPWMYLDEEHGVFAEHGHQLDRFNQRCDGSRFVPGDAMVVELLVQLPIRVASEIGASDPRSAQFAPAYAFLHEMDNVEPQTLEAFLCWLEYQMHDVASRESIEAALARASRTRTEELLREATQADWIYLEEEEPGSSDAWVAFVDADRSQLKARVRVIPAAARSADLEVLEFKPPNEGKHESEYVLGSVVAIDPQQVTLETRNNERRTVTLPENVAPPGQHSRVMALLPKGSTKPLSFELLDGWRDMLVANGAAQSEQHLP